MSTTNLNIPQNPCPCAECICLPVCKHKTYLDLFKECSILKDHVPAYDFAGFSRQSKVEQVVEILNPSQWQYLYDCSQTTDYKLILQVNSAVVMKGTNI